MCHRRCATIVRGNTELVRLYTEPSGARVNMRPGGSCTTPCEMHVRRKDPIALTIEREGCDTEEFLWQTGINKTSLGVGTAANILFLPIVNDVVDYRSGANYDHKPNPLVIELSCTKSDASTP